MRDRRLGDVATSVKSQAQTPSQAASWRTIDSRTGSARAARRRTSGSVVDRASHAAHSYR